MEEATTGTRPARTRRANTLFTGYSDVPATTGLLRSAPPPSSSPAPARRPPFADTNGGGAACSSEQPCSEGQGASASWLPEEEGLSEGQCSPDSHAGSSPAGLGGSNLLRRGKGRKRKHRDPTFTEEERCQIAAKATAGLQQTTAKNYQSHQKKLQAFFKLQGYDISACKSWEELATLLARAMEWVGNNMPGYSYPRKKDHMSGGLLKMVRSAAIKLPAGDPQQNTSGCVVSPAEVERLFDAWMRDGTLAATRDRAMNAANAQDAGRGDDVRGQYYADICPPVPHSQIGPVLCLMFLWLLKGGKATKVSGA
eukprot:scaffold14.g1048.t1